MFRRMVTAAAMVMVGLAPGVVSKASAQERVELPTVDVTSMVLNNTAMPAMRLADLEQLPPAIEPVALRRTGSSLLASMYATTAVMQAVDFHSTIQAFRAGATEGNPLMAGIARNRVAFVAVKAAVAASTILAARQIAKHSRIGAAVTMVAINSAYAMIARHNYGIASRR